MSDALARIRTQVMWNRLISVVEEQAQVLLRTAYGAVAREAGDLTAGVYDTSGRMLAQAVTGTPGHVNTMAMAVPHFLDRFPLATMKPGDVFVTNDPWLGTGPLFDFVIVTPAFRGAKAVALFASTCHLVDIGGLGFSADGRSVYEEGLYVPHMKLVSEGVLDETFMALLEANVREPVPVRGDVMSLVACNDAGCRRLLDMMGEFGLDDIDALADHIIDNSRTAMMAAIDALPAGTYRASMTIDGYEAPVELVAALTVGGGRIHVDYAGTSPVSRFAINSPKCYTDAYTSFGVKCLVAPHVPNNAGSLSVVTVDAPEGCIANAPPPSAVTARHVIGQMLPDLVFGCLHQALEGGAPAESAGSIWVVSLLSGHYAGDIDAADIAGTRRFIEMSVSVGGAGARPTKDGLSSTAFPSGVRAIPVEVTENATPLVFWRRELLPDSAGPGRWRGGHGQIVEIANTEDAPFAILAATFDRMRFAPRGREGGGDGAMGRARLASGREFTTKSVHTVPAGERLILELPGAGGFGDPRTRDPAHVADEVRNAMLSPAAARRHYAVAVSSEGEIDEAETAKLRGE